MSTGNAAIDAAVVDYVLADRNSEPLQVVLDQRHIPFVVVTAYPRPLVRTDVSKHILQKPVSAETLCDELREACREEPPTLTAPARKRRHESPWTKGVLRGRIQQLIVNAGH